MDIYSVGREIDMITVTEQLKLRGTLERVGGTQNLATLIDNVPTTSNIERYVEIVEQKATSRNLIKVTSDIMKVSYAQTEELDTIIEQAEKGIFDLAQNRNSKSYSGMKEILVTTLDSIEKMYDNKEKLSGMESGFIDLDEKISGLNDSDLIIVAARPAMGKSAFVLNIASCNSPVLVNHLHTIPLKWSCPLDPLKWNVLVLFSTIIIIGLFSKFYLRVSRSPG